MVIWLFLVVGSGVATSHYNQREVYQPQKPEQEKSLDYYIYEEHEEDEEPVGGHRPTARTRGGGIPMRSHHRTSEVQPPHSLTSDSSIFSQGETRDFLQFLRRIKYDHRQFPENKDGEAVVVEVSVVVSNIRAVSEVTMDYALELFYRESWIDRRLAYNRTLFKNKTQLALHESYTNFLWFPDTFVPNAIASKNPQRNSISHRSLLRLQDNGQLLYSRRISLVCECTMDLTLFPFDKQVCKLGIESYGYTADQVTYKWSSGSRSALTLLRIRLPDFTIKEAYVTSQMEVYATGNYSRLYVCFVFSRSSGFCFLQLIIPSTAVVITSWVSLWMESETEFQDMISIILAITFLIFSVFISTYFDRIFQYNEMMPRVSYIKAMDIYLGVCFMIVFLSLIKLAFVKYMRQKIKIERERQPDVWVRGSFLRDPLPIRTIRESSNSLTRLTHRDEKKRRTNGVARNGRYQAVAVPDLNEAFAPEPSKEYFTMMKEIFDMRLTQSTMHRFHWITQMLFFFGFVVFCLFYFLVYPNLHIVTVDPACDKSLAEWFADIV